VRRGAAILAVACVLGLGSSARAQDRDRERPEDDGGPLKTHEPPTLPSESTIKTAPPSPYDPSDEAPPPDAARPTNPLVPPPAKSAREPEPEAKGQEIEVETHARVRLELGYDSNVFRSEHGATGDGFFHGYGEGEVLIHLSGERELYSSVSGEGYKYFENGVADEVYATWFLDYYHPLNSTFDLDLQNTFEYSAFNLIDDNNDLLPRAKFDSYDEDARFALIAHLTNDLSLEIGGGGRYKHFEDTPDLSSLDYTEARGTVGMRLKTNEWWPDGKLKIRYVFRDRMYLFLPANSRDGTPDKFNQNLELQRHQVQVSYQQKLEFLGTKLVAQVGYSFVFNNDVIAGDRDYREHDGSAKLEWWLVPDWTRFEAELRVGERHFLVRKASTQFPVPDGSGGPALGQDYLESSLLFWQKIFDHVSLVTEADYFIYRSKDLRSNYTRLVLQAGIEASF
jgi:hypothetical protein